MSVCVCVVGVGEMPDGGQRVVFGAHNLMCSGWLPSGLTPPRSLLPLLLSHAAAAAIANTGYIAFQLPLSAMAYDAAGSTTTALHALQPPQQYQQPASAAARDDGSWHPPVLSTLSYGATHASEGSVWAQFSYLKDDQKAARRAMAMVSVSTAVLFRTTIEDNVACAATSPVTGAAVRAACEAVGASGAIMSLPVRVGCAGDGRLVCTA